MPKIIDYRLVASDSPGDLTDTVKRLIKEGWQPLQGASVGSSANDDSGFEDMFVQAMVRYEEAK